MNPSRLFEILGINSESDASWKTMIRHAKECDVGSNLYSYWKKNNLLFFNSVYEVVGAEFGNNYKSFDKVLPFEKILVNKWKKGFLENIMNGDPTPDFEMVNGQPVRVKSDFTGISTDAPALQNDGTAGLQDTEPSDVTHFSVASLSHLEKDSMPDIRRNTNQYITSDHNTASNNTSIQDEIICQVQEQEGSFISSLEFNSTSVEENLVCSAESCHVNNSERENLSSLDAFQQMLTYSQSPPPLNEADIIEVLNILDAEQPANISSEWNKDKARKTFRLCILLLRSCTIFQDIANLRKEDSFNERNRNA